MRIYNNEKLPILHWLHFSDIEAECLQQAKHLANLPFAFHHIALMPDCHSGYGMPIGGVLAADGAIVPNAVGVDIGCGMIAVQTELRRISEREIKDILHGARESIPVGFKHHASPQSPPDGRCSLFVDALHHRSPIIREELERAKFQLGTLGSVICT